MKFWPRVWGVLLLMVCLLPVQAVGARKIAVVASIFPIADMVRQVGGEYVDVTVVVPAGASPHTFEPKPSLLKKFSAARLYFMIGAGFETWSARFVNASARPPETVVLSKGLSLIRGAGFNHHPAGESEKDESRTAHDPAGAANPHVWLDPVYAVKMVSQIVSALVRLDDAHKAVYEQNGRAYISRLEALDRLISARVAMFRTKTYVAFHPAWDYFGRRYGLVSVGVIETTPGRNPTPKQIKKIIAEIKSHRIGAIFAEPQLNPKAAEVIAREAGIRMLLLDPMGGDGITGRSSYLDLMHYNLDILQEAMQ